MIIKKGTGPQRCVRCLRDKDEAIREHLAKKSLCCPECPFGNEIRQVLTQGSYVPTPRYQGHHDVDDVWSQIANFVIWVIIALPVYYVTYEVFDWDQTWAIVTAVFWPLALVVGIYYCLYKLIIGIF